MSTCITHGIFKGSCVKAFHEYSGDAIGPTLEKIEKKASISPLRTQDLAKKNLYQSPACQPLSQHAGQLIFETFIYLFLFAHRSNCDERGKTVER